MFTSIVFLALIASPIACNAGVIRKYNIDPNSITGTVNNRMIRNLTHDQSAACHPARSWQCNTTLHSQVKSKEQQYLQEVHTTALMTTSQLVSFPVQQSAYESSHAATALTTCMQPTTGNMPDPSALVTATHVAANMGAIDNPGNLTDARVYLYSGAKDTVVATPVVQAAEKYYRSLAMQGKITGVYTFGSEHCIPTLDFGMH